MSSKLLFFPSLFFNARFCALSFLFFSFLFLTSFFPNEIKDSEVEWFAWFRYQGTWGPIGIDAGSFLLLLLALALPPDSGPRAALEVGKRLRSGGDGRWAFGLRASFAYGLRDVIQERWGTKTANRVVTVAILVRAVWWALASLSGVPAPREGFRIALDVNDKRARHEGLASQVTDTQGVYFVPPFAGSDMVRTGTGSYNRGAILGVTRGVTKHHIVRAALEALAYQTRDFVEVIRKREPGPMPKVLRADGNISKSDFLLQFQADILNVPVIRPKVAETTALGAAYAAGLAVGFWKDYDELRANWGRDKEWQPQMDSSKRDSLYANWKKAVTRTFDWI